MSQTELIWIYALFAVLVIGYNLSVGRRERWRERAEARWLAALQPALARGLAPREQKALARRLGDAENAVALAALLREKPALAAGRAGEALVAAADSAVRRYRRRDDARRAAFCFFLAQLPTGTGNLTDFLWDCLLASSVYCRENALLALGRRGDAQGLARALRHMSLHDVAHSPRLLQEDLLAASCPPEELADALLAMFSQLSPPVQTALVDFCRLAGVERKCFFRRRLLAETTDDETCYALMRYFGRFPDLFAKRMLLRMLYQPRRGGWEYSAVAASVLRNYPGGDTLAALEKGITSANWYVRRNCAESLLALEAPAERIEAILDGKDPFAADIMEYVIQRHGLHRAVR